MVDYLLPLPPVMSLPVIGREGRFPVGRIFCVGRNYAAHAAEMGNEVDREAPFYFLKSPHAVQQSGTVLAYPPGTEDLHHEIELVVAIGKGGKDIPAEQAAEHIFGYAVGLDMTRRDLQLTARKAGRPWDMGKGFDQSAPMGALVPAAGIDPSKGKIELTVNGKVTQTSDLSKLIWSVPEVIANLSELVELAPGDLIMTGTPEGVGYAMQPPQTMKTGDVMELTIEGIGTLTNTVR